MTCSIKIKKNLIFFIFATCGPFCKDATHMYIAHTPPHTSPLHARLECIDQIYSVKGSTDTSIENINSWNVTALICMS